MDGRITHDPRSGAPIASAPAPAPGAADAIHPGPGDPDASSVHRFEGGVVALTHRGTDVAALCRAARGVASGEAHSLLLAFFHPGLDGEALGRGLEAALPDVPTQLGCSTAGEIGPFGYLDEGAVLLFFPASRFEAVAGVVSGVGENALERGAALAAALRVRLEDGRALSPAGGEARLALCLVDGLSDAEEAVVSAFDAGLGGMPLVGGSAGDGVRFERTRILFDGRLHEDAAALCLIRTSLPFRVFKSDHFRPTATRVVVTGCAGGGRLLTELNGVPAAPEYAAVLGLDPAGLDRFSFAAHPLVVRVGGEHFCRAIRQLEPEGLSLFCAVDEGVALTLAEPLDMAGSMDAVLEAEGETLGGLDFVLGFDCVLRRVEAEQRQEGRRVAEVFARHRVFGFTTYGEQFRAMHVNQTFTGVAFGRPLSPDRR